MTFAGVTTTSSILNVSGSPAPQAPLQHAQSGMLQKQVCNTRTGKQITHLEPFAITSAVQVSPEINTSNSPHLFLRLSDFKRLARFGEQVAFD